MESPAAAAAAPPRRRPLLPRDLNSLPSVGIRPKHRTIILRCPPSTGEGAAAERSQRPISHPEPPMDSGLREASLAEELAAIRSRRERLRAERERTEKALRERDALMHRWAVELEKWADEQRNLELEFRLLVQLQDLRCSSMMWSPVQSLRGQEQQRNAEEQLQGPDGAKQKTAAVESSSSQENGSA